MSDEKNLQPEVENEDQELSEEQLNDVAGGVIIPPILKSSPLISSNTFTGSIKPPTISSNTIDGIKGES